MLSEDKKEYRELWERIFGIDEGTKVKVSVLTPHQWMAFAQRVNGQIGKVKEKVIIHHADFDLSIEDRAKQVDGYKVEVNGRIYTFLREELEVVEEE